jgi:hypothetical protein
MNVYLFEPKNVATSGGVWQGTTLPLVGHLCRHCFVKSSSADTTFTVAVEDKDGKQVRRYTGATQEVNDLTPFIAKGAYTLKIIGASKDEPFEVLMSFSNETG